MRKQLFLADIAAAVLLLGSAAAASAADFVAPVDTRYAFNAQTKTTFVLASSASDVGCRQHSYSGSLKLLFQSEGCVR